MIFLTKIREIINKFEKLKIRYFLFVIRLCVYSNYAKLNPDHENIITFSIGCRRSRENNENQKVCFFVIRSCRYSSCPEVWSFTQILTGKKYLAPQSLAPYGYAPF